MSYVVYTVLLWQCCYCAEGVEDNHRNTHLARAARPKALHVDGFVGVLLASATYMFECPKQEKCKK